MADRTHLAEQLAATTRHLYEQGWMRGTSGNVSVIAGHDPVHLLVSASGITKHRTTIEHAVLTDHGGIAVEGQSHAPSAEAMVHAAIIAESDAHSVVHVHAMASVLAASRWPAGVVLADNEQLKGLGCPPQGERVVVPVVDNSQDMGELSERVRRALDPAVPVVIVKDHGMYVWGRSLDDAANRTESAEWLLQHALLTALVGRA